MEKIYTPAHEKTVEVTPKWSGTQLRRIKKEYDGDVARTIQQARIPGAVSVVLEDIPKKEGQMAVRVWVVDPHRNMTYIAAVDEENVWRM